MFAGDYCRADLDSVHDESYSETGCGFLLMASPEQPDPGLTVHNYALRRGPSTLSPRDRYRFS